MCDQPCDRMKNIVLQDGENCCSYCPLWRDETLTRSQTARGIVKMEDIEHRRAAVRQFGLQHGEEAEKRLVDQIALIWQDRHTIRSKSK